MAVTSPPFGLSVAPMKYDAVACEERGGRRDLLRPAEPAERRSNLRRRAELGVERARRRDLDEPGRDGIHSYALDGELLCHSTREPEDARFRRE